MPPMLEEHAATTQTPGLRWNTVVGSPRGSGVDQFIKGVWVDSRNAVGSASRCECFAGFLRSVANPPVSWQAVGLSQLTRK